MKLLINTASTHKGGGVQVAWSFIRCCRHFPEHTYHVVLSPALEMLPDSEVFGANFKFYRLHYRPGSRVFSFRSHDEFLRSLEESVKPDCVFTTSGPAYWRPKAPHLVGFNLGHHVYLDSPFFGRISFVDRVRWKIKRILHLFFFRKESDALVAQTYDVSGRLRLLFPRIPVYTVLNTYNGYYSSRVGKFSRLPSRSTGEFRFLILSAYHQHKNLEVLNSIVPRLEAMGLDHIRFVTTIEEETASRIFHGEVRRSVLNIGPVSIHECPGLYQEVDAVFLPTLLECFSASYPEAMVMRKAILTSNLGFARTVCADAAIYFDPTNPSDIVEKIVSIVENPKLREDLIDKGIEQLKQFPTELQRAESYLRICMNLYSINHK